MAMTMVRLAAPASWAGCAPAHLCPIARIKAGESLRISLISRAPAPIANRSAKSEFGECTLPRHLAQCHPNSTRSACGYRT